MKGQQEIEVKKGTWLYDNQKPMVVRIFCLNYDYFYDLSEADGLLSENEQPVLNDKGEMYMIKWGNGGFYDQDLATVDDGGLDLKTAIKRAEEKIESGIIWD